jgi:hypothetical protein
MRWCLQRSHSSSLARTEALVLDGVEADAAARIAIAVLGGAHTRGLAVAGVAEGSPMAAERHTGLKGCYRQQSSISEKAKSPEVHSRLVIDT